MSCDVLIIGGGPAGLSAAINVRSRGKSALVVSNPLEENPLWKSPRIDNYPGMPGVTGAELLRTFRNHAEQAGVEFLEGKALNTALAGDTWYVSVGSDVREARSVILSAGISRGAKIPGEEEYLGRGVSYCATCDGMLYRGKRVAVLGWSDSAAREAEFLRRIGCETVYYEKPKSCVISGGSTVERLVCDGRTEAVDGVFILRPAMAPTDLFPGLAMENGAVVVGRDAATNLPGLFAAGDCTGGPLQIAKAVGEGMLAGQNAAKWIDAHRNG
jgi:thioredoxin reductase (NADPH)